MHERHFSYLTGLLVGFSLLLTSCSDRSVAMQKTRFHQVSSKSSGIDFENNLTENDSFNYFTYPYIYMGGGVAVGDLNNDALPDLFFTGNMVENTLYLNKGNMTFDNIAISAGTQGDDRWYTGVTMVDINADGFLDIYTSVSGKFGDKNNQLYINNGDLTFSESAAAYGIDDDGQSIQSAFFDYDHDGDLDLFVVNYPVMSFNTPNSTYSFLMSNPKLEQSDHLFRNEGDGTFTDVTEAAGLMNFGLGISGAVSDYNGDGWDDIYVSNDFSTPDFLYINNGDGTFTDQLRAATKQTAFYGMGTDAADYNNDGLIDLFQVDMAPEDNRRSKANMASMDANLFWSTVNYGFHYQYMYNALQLNQGISEDKLPMFRNVAWLAGVSSTDWSWAPIMADFDNDGWKDLFVSNGSRREINNKDYFKDIEKTLRTFDPSDSLLSLSINIPSEPIDNYIYRNKRDLTFERVNDEWGLSMPGFSNGAAYADLDNDGDLDLVINNFDDVSAIFENGTSEMENAHFLKVQFENTGANLRGIGAKITIITADGQQFLQLHPTRGFQSSMEPQLHVGLGKATFVDSLIVEWPDGSSELLTKVAANQTVTLIKGQQAPLEKKQTETTTLFASADERFDSLFWHDENLFDDFKPQVLIPHKLSNLGPALAVGDINGDELDDFYVGNGAGYSGVLYVQQPDGNYEISTGDWSMHSAQEDVGATFFDADGDGDQDLYVVSGGNAFSINDHRYQDRLYLNNNGHFEHTDALPFIGASGSRVIPRDVDQDGDIDLFVGGRISPQNYPFPGQSYLLINRSETGTLSFEDQTEALAPGLSDIGMVTDAVWTDFDQDGAVDLVVTGEWMPITIFRQEGNQFIDATETLGYDNTRGWWFSIEASDLDQDGDVDLVAGNLGLNYKYQAATDETFDIYVNDFDKNGKPDLVLGYYNTGTQYPVRGRQCSAEQIPAIKTKYKDYATYADASIIDIYGSVDLEASLHYAVSSFASIYLENIGDGHFKEHPLPLQAQLAPINDIIIDDVNHDGHLDLITAGNLYASEVETPRADASIGLVLLGNSQGDFDPQTYAQSGINMTNDTKNLGLIKGKDGIQILAVSNRGPLQLFQRKDAPTQ